MGIAGLLQNCFLHFEAPGLHFGQALANLAFCFSSFKKGICCKKIKIYNRLFTLTAEAKLVFGNNFLFSSQVNILGNYKSINHTKNGINLTYKVV